MLNASNIYIDLLNKIKESGGAVPPELVEEVEALDVTVNGDETTEPPTVGLVDIVGDLGDEVEDLDIDINGDDTTEPPTPGLKDRVKELETTINGDSSVSPIIPPLLAGAGNMRMILLWENSDTTQQYSSGTISLSSGDYDILLFNYNLSTSGLNISSLVFKGANARLFSVSGSDSAPVGCIGIWRDITYTSDTALAVGDCRMCVSGNAPSVNNSLNIPVSIYGIKIMSN